MAALIAGRTASEMPGLDIAEQKSWQNFLDSTLRLYRDAQSSTHRCAPTVAVRRQGPRHAGQRADRARPDGRSRRGAGVAAEPADSSGPSPRGAGAGAPRGQPGRRRGVVAAITDDGRAAARAAMVTYAQGVRTYFLGQLSRSQIAAMGENCRRISAALKRSERASSPASPLPLSAVAWQSGLMHSP